MADDVWSALVRGILAFAHSRAGDLTGSSFKDTGSLLASLVDSSPEGTTKAKLDQLKQDIKDLKPLVQQVADAIKGKVKDAKTAVTNMATQLGTDPFTIEAAGRGATELAFVLKAFDEALDIVADKLAEQVPAGADHDTKAAQIKADIKGIDEPWKKPFRSLAGGITEAFDAFCKVVLGIDNAGADLADKINWSRADNRLGLTMGAASARSVGPLAFDGASLEVFFAYKTVATLGLALHVKLQTGLRNDKLLEKIIPGQAKTADTDSVAINLDTHDGLTFGTGKDKRLVLPVRFSFPGIELREFSIARPELKDLSNGRIDVMITIAGKIGDVFGVVAEGGGVTISWVGGNSAIDVKPKPPSSTGVRINAGVVSGGGFLRYKEETKEYGGVLDLQFTKIGITAIGLIGTEPFSFVVVIGVHFLPKIELSFGFTLNGLGGILAIERTLDSDALAKGLKDGAVGQLLFPENPIDAAPQILDRLAQVFPPRAGGFVIGPIAELGWGSQAGFLKARLGIVLSLPDPKIVILGAMQIGVPSADVPPNLRVVDIHAELLGEITPDFFLIRVSLAPSKLAGLTLSGDLGILIQWSGEAAFAISVGGFFPKYTPPPQLADLRRVAIELSPPVKWLTVHAEAYVAVTSNTIQFGGKIVVSADLDVASAKAWISLDALFQWSPRFYFIFIVDVGIEVKAFGHTIAGVAFHGELQGTKPWRLEGKASVDILFWTVDADIGPEEWGEKDTTVAPTVNPLEIARAALQADAAWTPQLPGGSDMLVRLTEADLPLLVHPLGSLDVKQLAVPLEIDIDRIGSSPVSVKRINLSSPKVGGQDAKAVSHSIDNFSPGHFIQLPDDQQAGRPDFEAFPCGMKLAITTVPSFGDAQDKDYEWQTVFPHQSFGNGRDVWFLGDIAASVMRTGAVAVAQRLRDNPYRQATRSADDTLGLVDAGVRQIRLKNDLGSVAAQPLAMTTTQAAQFVMATSAGDQTLELVALGVAA